MARNRLVDINSTPDESVDPVAGPPSPQGPYADRYFGGTPYQAPPAEAAPPPPPPSYSPPPGPPPGSPAGVASVGPSGNAAGLDQRTVDALKALGIPIGDGPNWSPPEYASSLVQMELDAQLAPGGDVFGAPLGGFKFPAGPFDVADFTTAESWAQKFAANSNYHYMPTAAMIWNAYQSGVKSYQEASNLWFGKLNDQQKKDVPWLQQGLDKQSYTSQRGELEATLERLTGNRDLGQIDAGMQATLLDPNNSMTREARLREHLSSKGMTWLDKKYGYDYQSWQSYKRSNRQAVISRYGQASADSDASYLNEIDNPLREEVSAQGGAVTYERSASALRDYSTVFGGR